MKLCGEHKSNCISSPKHFRNDIGLGGRLQRIEGDRAKDLSFPPGEQRRTMECRKGVHATFNSPEVIESPSITPVMKGEQRIDLITTSNCASPAMLPKTRHLMHKSILTLLRAEVSTFTTLPIIMSCKMQFYPLEL